MSVTGSELNEDSIEYNNVDANTLWVATEDLDLSDAKFVGMFVKGATGDHVNHKVIYQLYDGVNWWDTYHEITGEGFFHDEVCVAYKIRAKIETVEGSPSTINIRIIIK